jgi:Secretion system C-terminal sorting domain
MKNFTLLLIAIALSTSSIVMAQLPCPMKCWQENFPYWFCPITGGTPVVLCSNNPDTVTGYVSSKIHMPGCVNLTTLDTSYWYQPDSAVPNFTETPPDKESMWENYISEILVCTSCYPPPYTYSYDEAPEFWGYDTTAYEAAIAQWELDSTCFFNQQAQSIIDLTGLDSIALYFFRSYHYEAYAQIFNDWKAWYGTYQSDSIRHFTGNDVSYTQVWNPGQANTDADNGRLAWLACCGITGDPGCCIFIEPNDSIIRWPGTYGPPGPGVSFGVGFTFVPFECEGGHTCPPSNARYIIYNTSNKFLYQNIDNRIITNPGYILRPAAPLNTFYTGSTPNHGYLGYYTLSFSQTVEHEEGHWLGLNHPQRLSSDNASCINNQTQCADSLAFPMLMGSAIIPNNAPIDMQPDDKCMFEKLYCPGTRDDDVEEVETPEPPSPEIFPNPTTGACQLQYEVVERSLVQVAIYDILGKEVRDVMNDYSSDGQQSISLGTETLPSGSYVCRVRVGDRVSYINLSITK